MSNQSLYLFMVIQFSTRNPLTRIRAKNRANYLHLQNSNTVHITRYMHDLVEICSELAPQMTDQVD